MTTLERLASKDQTMILHALDEMWHDMQIRVASLETLAAVKAEKIVACRARYESVAKETGVPWWLIGVLHHMESDGDFTTHLHNGDSLKKLTVSFPKGRPCVDHKPPFTWEESAIDALRFDGLAERTEWKRACDVLDVIERYNGLGYRKLKIASPYLWSGSTYYTSGKFASDGGFESRAVSKQTGAALILRALQDRGVNARLSDM